MNQPLTAEDLTTVHEYLHTKDHKMAALQEQLANAIAERQAWMREAAMLLEACEDALEFIADQEDVVDGDYGLQEPNQAMLAASRLREAINKATKP